jgi:ABC-type multidrug transport system fused ATPase/permease subunit
MRKSLNFLLNTFSLLSIKQMWFIVGSVACLVFVAVCNTYTPVLLKNITDQLGGAQDKNEILYHFILYAILLTLSKIFFEVKILFYAKWETILIEKTLCSFFEKCLKNNPLFFKTYTSGNISSKLFMSVWGLKNLTGDVIFTVLPVLIEFTLISYSVFFFFDFKIASIVSLGLFLYTMFAIYSNKKIISAQRPLRKKVVETEGVLIELILSWKDIKLLNCFQKVCQLFKLHTEKISSLSVQFTNKKIVLNIILGMISVVTILSANYLIIQQFFSNIVTIGNVVLINAYLLQLVKPLENLVLVLMKMSHDWNDFILGEELQNFKQEAISTIPLPESESPKKLELRNVNLKPFLINLNLTFNIQERVAIVGESGSGKSTFFEILTRLKENYDGEILLDNKNTQSLRHDELRNIIQFTPSDSRLINYSIKENLLLSGNQDVEKIKTILENLFLDSRVNALNLESESIESLSQGEKQRLIIARAWLKECKIKLYDESTSFLDSNTESVILEQILPKKDDIILFITHRIASALQFPRVIVFHEGEVVEDGSPIQLLSNKKHFYKLWKKQCTHPLSMNMNSIHTV